MLTVMEPSWELVGDVVAVIEMSLDAVMGVIGVGVMVGDVGTTPGATEPMVVRAETPGGRSVLVSLLAAAEALLREEDKTDPRDSRPERKSTKLNDVRGCK